MTTSQRFPERLIDEILNAPDAERFSALLFEAARAGSAMPQPGRGVTREAFGEIESELLDFLERLGARMGLKCARDKGGNLHLRFEGTDAEAHPVLSGSHADSVPEGGNYDGFAGIVAALACVFRWQKEGFRPRRPFVAVALRGEENAFFGKPYLGVTAALGRMDDDVLKLTHRTTGEGLGERLTSLGIDIASTKNGKRDPLWADAHAFLELHIEQAPTLERDPKVRTGVVTGIRGSCLHRHIVTEGETGHGGAVAKEDRHDAVLATADLLMAMEAYWADALVDKLDIVFTPGIFRTSDAAAVSAVAGTVTWSADIRSESAETRERFHGYLLEAAESVAKARGVRFHFDDPVRFEPAPMDERLVALLLGCARVEGIPARAMPSGAGHDSAAVANAGIPTAMIFVANANGSHNPDEAMRSDDFMQGVRLLDAALRRLMR